MLETRRELEKSLVVRQFRDQISRLSDRLVVAETELAEVKRSCQFTALTEMHTVVEEYMNEVMFSGGRSGEARAESAHFGLVRESTKRQAVD